MRNGAPKMALITANNTHSKKALHMITSKLELFRYLEEQNNEIYAQVWAIVQDLAFAAIVAKIKEYAVQAENCCPIAKLSLLF